MLGGYLWLRTQGCFQHCPMLLWAMEAELLSWVLPCKVIQLPELSPLVQQDLEHFNCRPHLPSFPSQFVKSYFTNRFCCWNELLTKPFNNLLFYFAASSVYRFTVWVRFSLGMNFSPNTKRWDNTPVKEMFCGDVTSKRKWGLKREICREINKKY